MSSLEYLRREKVIDPDRKLPRGRGQINASRYARLIKELPGDELKEFKRLHGINNFFESTLREVRKNG